MSVWQKQKNWWNEVLWKPKKALSLDQLKFQHHVLLKNPVVTDNNKQLLVETFRSITEILIWGDQNDSRVFDFFLEKNMQSYFLKILTQKCGHYVCVQLLQTLNILLENIRNETSIYYLLSNNHINSIIVLKLDFSDEEVLAYYISFLKTLSFHLNKHTIHFFYNEHLRDFPLYTEAIKFFKHSEGMVRIAVRTLTLNVFKVEDKVTLDYICNKTAAPYFSNLSWFIGNHVIELDECLISQAHHLNRGRLESLVAEHLDHLHYMSDIFSLEVQCLNDILSDHFLNRLLIPLYIYSLVDAPEAECEQDQYEPSPRISSTVSLFLLSQVFLILSHPCLVTPLAYLMFTGDTSLDLPPILQGHKRGNSYNSICAFVQPESSLETSLVRHSSQVHAHPISMAERKTGGNKGSISQASHTSQDSVEGYVAVEDDQYIVIEASPSSENSSRSSQSSQQVTTPHSPTYRPPRKQHTPSSPRKLSKSKLSPPGSDHHGIPIVSRQFLNSLMSSLIIQHDDSRCLFGLSILYAMLKNKGIHHKLLEAFSLRPPKSKQETDEGHSHHYNSELVALLLSTLDSCTSASSSIRLITLRLTIMLLTELLEGQQEGGAAKKPAKAMGADAAVSGTEEEKEEEEEGRAMLQDHHIALVEHIYESAKFRLRMFYTGPQDEVFLEMFEDEYEKERSFKLKLSYMMMDASMLLPPTTTPLTGIDFTRRLPCGDHERARKAMRVFFAMRGLSQQMSGMKEEDLPLTKPTNSAAKGDVVDTDNCDLLSCKMILSDKATHHFMMFNETEFLLVTPHKVKLGCGVVDFIAFIQDIDISGDPANIDSLFFVVHNRNSAKKRPKLSGKFVFEDHIRCSAAKSVFQRAREHLHHSKMLCITEMLDLPPPESPSAITVNTHHQQKQLLDATPPSVASSTATVTTGLPTRSTFSPPTSSQLTSSALHEVFQGASPVASSSQQQQQQQEFELSALSTPNRIRISLLQENVPVSDSPVRLTLPAPLPPNVNPSSAASPMGTGHVMGRDASLTPEPQPYLGTGDTEERLTASGGLFQYSNMSSSLGFEESLMLGFDGDRVKASRVRPGKGPEDRTIPVMDRLDTTGESVVTTEEHDTSTEHAHEDTSHEDTSIGFEHAHEDTSTEHAHVDAFTEHAHEDTSTEHAHEDTSTEHAHEDTSSDHAHEDTSTEHAHEDTSSEHAHEDTSTEHAHEDTSTKHAHEDTSSEHAHEDTSVSTELEHAHEDTSTKHAQEEEVTDSRHSFQENAGLHTSTQPENVGNLTQELSTDENVHTHNNREEHSTQEVAEYTSQDNVLSSTALSRSTASDPTDTHTLDNVFSTKEDLTREQSIQDKVVSPEHAELEDESRTLEHELDEKGEGSEVTAIGVLRESDSEQLNSANTGDEGDEPHSSTQPNQELPDSLIIPGYSHTSSISPSKKLVNGVLAAAKSDLVMDSEPLIGHISLHTEHNQASPVTTEHAQWSTGSGTELNTDSESNVNSSPHPPGPMGDAWVEGSKPLVLPTKPTDPAGVPVTFDIGPGHVTAETGERTPPYHANSSDSVTHLISQ